MSTNANPLQSDNHRNQELQQFLDSVHDAQHLLRPDQLPARLTVLDKLDAILGATDSDLLGAPDSDLMEIPLHPTILARAKTLRSQLEDANETLYAAARAEISQQGNSPLMHRWLMEVANVRGAERVRPGLSFDLLDEIVSGVLQFHEPDKTAFPLSPEMVPYQPTPVRHILDFIATCKLSSSDILIDLGSGLGHVPLLISILTGIRTLGVEIQPDYVASAQHAAQNLNLRQVRFVTEDARMTDISSGTVFFLFSPFSGSILADLLHRLQEQSQKRRIRIGTLGPCTHTVQVQSWLMANQQPDAERITVFHSR